MLGGGVNGRGIAECTQQSDDFGDTHTAQRAEARILVAAPNKTLGRPALSGFYNQQLVFGCEKGQKAVVGCRELARVDNQHPPGCRVFPRFRQPTTIFSGSFTALGCLTMHWGRLPGGWAGLPTVCGASWPLQRSGSTPYVFTRQPVWKKKGMGGVCGHPASCHVAWSLWVEHHRVPFHLLCPPPTSFCIATIHLAPYRASRSTQFLPRFLYLLFPMLLADTFASLPRCISLPASSACCTSGLHGQKWHEQVTLD